MNSRAHYKSNFLTKKKEKECIVLTQDVRKKRNSELHTSLLIPNNVIGMQDLVTSLGAIREDKVMVFSGGIAAFVFPIITRESPEGTALTFPLNHPAVAGADAMPIADA